MQLSPFWQQYAEPHRWPAKGKNKKQQENISPKEAFYYDIFHFRGAFYGTLIRGEVRMMKTLVQKNIFYDILKREVVDVSTSMAELGQSPIKLANLLKKNLAMIFFIFVISISCDK